MQCTCSTSGSRRVSPCSLLPCRPPKAHTLQLHAPSTRCARSHRLPLACVWWPQCAAAWACWRPPPGLELPAGWPASARQLTSSHHWMCPACLAAARGAEVGGHWGAPSQSGRVGVRASLPLWSGMATSPRAHAHLSRVSWACKALARAAGAWPRSCKGRQGVERSPPWPRASSKPALRASMGRAHAAGGSMGSPMITEWQVPTPALRQVSWSKLDPSIQWNATWEHVRHRGSRCTQALRRRQASAPLSHAAVAAAAAAAAAGSAGGRAVERPIDGAGASSRGSRRLPALWLPPDNYLAQKVVQSYLGRALGQVWRAMPAHKDDLGAGRSKVADGRLGAPRGKQMEGGFVGRGGRPACA